MKRDDWVFLAANLIIWLLVYSVSFHITRTEPKEEIKVAATISHSTVDADNSMEILSVANKKTGKEPDDVTDYGNSFLGEAVSAVIDSLAGAYISKSGYTFYFGPNGYYSGFFDSQNKDVDGGTYEMKENENGIEIKIISPDGQRMVTYLMHMNGPSDYTLIYEPTGFEMRLEKVK